MPLDLINTNAKKTQPTHSNKNDYRRLHVGTATTNRASPPGDAKQAEQREVEMNVSEGVGLWAYTRVRLRVAPAKPGMQPVSVPLRVKSHDNIQSVGISTREMEMEEQGPRNK